MFVILWKPSMCFAMNLMINMIEESVYFRCSTNSSINQMDNWVALGPLRIQPQPTNVGIIRLAKYKIKNVFLNFNRVLNLMMKIYVN